MTFKTKTSLMAAAALTAMMLAACGGDDDGGEVPVPTPNPNNPSNPSNPSNPRATGRIEPYDLPAKAEAKAAARSRLPAQAPIAQVDLGALAQAKSDEVLNQNSGPGVPLQIGLARPAQATAAAGDFAGLLNWTPTADGAQVAAIRFTSDQAYGVRLGLKVEQLPEEAVLRFYGDVNDAAGGEVVEVSAKKVLELLALNRQAGVKGDEAITYWGPDFGGAATTLEIELPATVRATDVQLSVPSVMHNVIDPARVQDFQLKGIGDAGSCNLNITCNSALLNTESRAEAQMSFASGGKQYVCSGTLMNDAKNSGTPYFLTANHCLSTQAEASTLQTRWFFRAASCGSASSMYSGARQLSGGARMLYASANTDTAFMQLNERPPAGVRYAGSYFGGVVPVKTSMTGVHHPHGDLQKYSEGVVAGYARNTRPGGSQPAFETGTTPQNFLWVQWQKGTTEGGSSGSGVFVTMVENQTRYLVGQLYGGSASCSNREGGDAYGRFDLAYSAALSRWLNP